MFLLDDSTVFRVDKSEWWPSVCRSIVALRAAAEQGAPVPAIYGTARIDGRLGVAMERLDSRHLLNLLGDAPWRVAQVGRIMGTVHASLHNIPAPAALPTTYESILSRMAQSDLLAARRCSLPDSWRILPGENQLLHGDFNPANLLRRPGTGEWLAVDWAGASRGDPAADVAYTLALIARGLPPATASRLSKFAAPAGRLLLASAYLAEYMRHRRLDLGVVGRWLSLWITIRAAERSSASRVLYEWEASMPIAMARSRFWPMMILLMAKLLARFGGRVSLEVISRLAGPGVGETRRGALARRMLRPLRSSDVVIPFGRCSGLPFNAGGSAPSFALGISEPDVQAMLANLLAPGMVFYDIGANVGFYTVLGARCVGLTGHVYAFEPLPSNIAALRRNLELMRFEAATVLPYAVADCTGTVDFTVAEEPFWGRLAALPAPRGATTSIQVSTTSIDDLLFQGLVAEPDVVKIDVEGAELDALRGMMGTLRLSHPAIVCEMHGKWAPIVEILESERYRVQPLNAGGGNRSARSRHLVATYNE